jgi:predicted metal-dependent hydrolase
VDRSYQDIQYSLIRSRRRTACIIIGHDGRVTLRVPMRFKIESVEQFIESKRAWIGKHLAALQGRSAARIKREYVNGEGFLYLGRTYPLKLIEDQAEPLLLKDGHFCLRSDLAPPGSAVADEVFKDFYRRQVITAIPERLAYYQGKMGVTPGKIKVTESRCRWASCSAKGNLRFHWKCMMAPPAILDYLVVHELAHLIVPGHPPRFWQEVGKYLPDYAQRRRWLKLYGSPFLTWKWEAAA